jgi:hypothetical protein
MNLTRFARLTPVSNPRSEKSFACAAKLVFWKALARAGAERDESRFASARTNLERLIEPGREREATMAGDDRELEFQLTEESWERVLALADGLLNVILLDELREARKTAQTALINTLPISGREISPIEYRTVETLDGYMKDPGELLEVWAVFPHGRIKINRLADFD